MARTCLALLTHIRRPWRAAQLPKNPSGRIEKWSLTSLQQPLVKTGDTLAENAALIR
jgi:hypothetical protein